MDLVHKNLLFSFYDPTMREKRASCSRNPVRVFEQNPEMRFLATFLASRVKVGTQRGLQLDEKVGEPTKKF